MNLDGGCAAQQKEELLLRRPRAGRVEELGLGARAVPDAGAAQLAWKGALTTV